MTEGTEVDFCDDCNTYHLREDVCPAFPIEQGREIAPEHRPWTWSHSSTSLYKECPRKYEIIRWKKEVIEPSGKAAEIGVQIHEYIEGFLKTGIFPDNLLKWEKLLRHYHAKDGIAEAAYAFDPNLKRVEPDDPNAWYRGYLDWLKIEGDEAHVVDWKTGKVKPTKQLALYAWVIFTAHPEVMKVKGTFHWINANDQMSEWYDRSQLEELFKPYQQVLEAIQLSIDTDTWIETPGFWCRWCSLTNKHCSNGRPPEGDF